MPDHEKSLTIIQYIILCMNVITWIISAVVIGLCFWLRFNDDIEEWVEQLSVQRFYIGLYILIVSCLIVMATGFLSCIATFSKNRRLIAINVLVQLALFVLGLAGAAVLLDNSTFKSSIHGVIKEVMVDLIRLHPSYGKATVVLQNIQEEVGCCGGSGYNDYINLNRALPTECRDPVTGNTFFYGCADEITWRLEAPATWIAALVLVLCAKKVLNAVLSTIVIQLIVEIENDK